MRSSSCGHDARRVKKEENAPRAPHICWSRLYVLSATECYAIYARSRLVLSAVHGIFIVMLIDWPMQKKLKKRKQLVLKRCLGGGYGGGAHILGVRGGALADRGTRNVILSFLPKKQGVIYLLYRMS